MKPKTFLKSKKCLAYLVLMAASTGLIAASIVMRQPSEVIRELIGSYGMAVTGASLALISGQAWIDSKSTTEAPTEAPAEDAPETKKDGS